MMGNKIIAEEHYFAAAKLLEQRDFSNVPSAVELKGQHSFSDRFEARMAEIILLFDSASARRRTAVRILLAAAIIALLFALAISYSALKNRTYKPLTMQTYEYTDMDFIPVYTDDNEHSSCCGSIPCDEPDYFEPAIELSVHYELSQLPEGYTEREQILSALNNMIVYSNENDELIVFQQCIIDTSFRINTENAVTKEVSVDGITFYCTDLNNTSTLLWEQEGYAFSLDCPFSSDEAIKIARSVTLR